MKAKKRTSKFTWAVLALSVFAIYHYVKKMPEGGYAPVGNTANAEPVQLSEEQLDDISRRAKKSAGEDMVIGAKRAVKLRLNDPDSAAFRDVRYFESEEGTIAVCGLVNAKNSFGGYTGFRPFVATDKEAYFETDNVRFGDMVKDVCG